MDARNGGDGAGRAEEMKSTASRLSLPEARDEGRDAGAHFGDHALIGIARNLDAAMTLGQSDDAAGERRPVFDAGPRAARASRLAHADKNQLRRAAANVENKGRGAGAIEKRRATGHGKARLVLVGNDFKREAGFGLNAIDEGRPTGGGPARSKERRVGKEWGRPGSSGGSK